MGEENKLSKLELERYSRHLVIPEVGLEGQEKLKAASVLVIGAGGLGSPAVLYLAAAGVGTIGIVDFDEVDLSNLQRQVLYTTEDVGKSKVRVAYTKALKLNPEIKVVQHEEELNAANIDQTFKNYDVIVDGSDNFETRYLVNDACVLLNKPNVHGAVHRFEGQASVFKTGAGPCYRCVFREPPVAGTVLNCAQAGVLGVLPGIVGTIQATECLKLILSLGESLTGRLLLIDALAMSFRTIKIKRDPNCTVCGDNPSVSSARQPNMQNIGCQTISFLDPTELASEFANGKEILLVDVREANEFNYSHLRGAVHIPLGHLAARMVELPAQANIVVYCKSGARSRKAVELMQLVGMTNVRNLKGGIRAWTKQVDTSMSFLD
jgi:adenylyltransferase/sulfurtransferase